MKAPKSYINKNWHWNNSSPERNGIFMNLILHFWWNFEMTSEGVAHRCFIYQPINTIHDIQTKRFNVLDFALTRRCVQNHVGFNIGSSEQQSRSLSVVLCSPSSKDFKIRIDATFWLKSFYPSGKRFQEATSGVVAHGSSTYQSMNTIHDIQTQSFNALDFAWTRLCLEDHLGFDIGSSEQQSCYPSLVLCSPLSNYFKIRMEATFWLKSLYPTDNSHVRQAIKLHSKEAPGLPRRFTQTSEIFTMWRMPMNYSGFDGADGQWEADFSPHWR